MFSVSILLLLEKLHCKVCINYDLSSVLHHGRPQEGVLVLLCGLVGYAEELFDSFYSIDQVLGTALGITGILSAVQNRFKHIHQFSCGEDAYRFVEVYHCTRRLEFVYSLLCEGEPLRIRHYDVVKEHYFEDIGGVPEIFGGLDVSGSRMRVSSWVVVEYDQACSLLQ